ncbi:TPA: hypothetical protein ACSCYS_004284 [Aeromonas veronii]
MKQDQTLPPAETADNETPAKEVKRSRGRPVTGNAKSRAEIQSNYRKNKAMRTVTVTHLRDDIPALKMILANTPETLGIPQEVIDRLTRGVFDAALD